MLAVFCACIYVLLVFSGSLTSKGDKAAGSVVGQALQFSSPPVARLPPPVETFVAPPTTIGPYANTPYFVSRTIPFVRAYPHMGVPFFACPLPGAGETSTLPAPYGQFVPMVPATVGQSETDSIQKNRGPSDRQSNRRNKKKLSNSEYSSLEAEGEEAAVTASSPVSTTVSSDRPTSVPLVPLPVPPSTFGTLPLHGYPPGLHTLPYTQMSGPQAPSAAMYYVPVFNHPYGSYIPSPPSAPMVLPVNLRPENEASVDAVTNTPSNCEVTPDATAKNTLSDCSSEEAKDATRCWADLFKKPEVNGITTDLNNLGKEVTNGKLYSVPVSDSVL